jgi:hypothetical protein
MKFLPTTNYLVVLREYERGYGSKDFHAEEYAQYSEAKAFCDLVNSENTASTAPDYYIQARIITNPEEFGQYERYL